MAYTATVTKQSVEKLTEHDYRIVIHIEIDDGSNVVFEGNYSERYYSSLEVDAVKVKLQQQIVADWDKYVAEQDIFNAQAFDTMVSEIETAANNYINQ